MATDWLPFAARCCWCSDSVAVRPYPSSGFRSAAVAGPSAATRWAGGGYAAVPVHMAESLSAVTACVGLIADSIASLPASLVVDTPQGCQPAPPTSPAWRVLRRPNAYQSWPSLMQWTCASVLMNGNAVLRADYDARGAVTGLTPVPWSWVLPSVIASTGGARLVYDVVCAAIMPRPMRGVCPAGYSIPTCCTFAPAVTPD